MTGNNNGRGVARACVVENRTYVRIFLADMPMTPRKFERTVLAGNYAAVA